jgi:hypothetical protein
LGPNNFIPCAKGPSRRVRRNKAPQFGAELAEFIEMILALPIAVSECIAREISG